MMDSPLLSVSSWFWVGCAYSPMPSKIPAKTPQAAARKYVLHYMDEPDNYGEWEEIWVKSPTSPREVDLKVLVRLRLVADVKEFKDGE